MRWWRPLHPRPPPEQASGRAAQVGKQSDVFARGAILCHILTGQWPDPGGDFSRAVAAGSRLRSGALLFPRRCLWRPCRAIELARACLAPDWAARPADAEAVRRSISTYRTSAEERVRAAELAKEVATTNARHARRARKLLAAIAASVVLGNPSARRPLHTSGGITKLKLATLLRRPILLLPTRPLSICGLTTRRPLISPLWPRPSKAAKRAESLLPRADMPALARRIATTVQELQAEQTAIKEANDELRGP